MLTVAQDGEGVFCAVLAQEGANVAERIVGGGISVDFFEHVADSNASEFGGRFLDDAGDSKSAKVRRCRDEDEAAHIRDEEIVEVGIWLEDDGLIGIVKNNGEAIEDFSTDGASGTRRRLRGSMLGFSGENGERILQGYFAELDGFDAAKMIVKVARRIERREENHFLAEFGQFMSCGKGWIELHGFGLSGCDREEAMKSAAMAEAEFGVEGRNAIERLHFQFCASAFVLERLRVVELQSLAIITDNDDEMAEDVGSQNSLDGPANARREIAEGIEREGRYGNLKTGEVENDVGQRFGASGTVRKKAKRDGANIVERRNRARGIEKKPRWPCAVHADRDENEMIRNFHGDLRDSARKSELE